MVFSSSVFLFGFLPILLLIYFLVPQRFKNYVLLCFSLLFYAWGEPKNIIIMVLSIIVNYFLGICVSEGHRYRKIGLLIAVLYDLGILFVFKYFNFTVDIIRKISNKEIEIMWIFINFR